MLRLERQHERQIQRPCAVRWLFQGTDQDGVVGAVPKPHHQSKQVGAAQGIPSPWKGPENESNGSSGDLTQRCREIVDKVEELIQTNQLYGLVHSCVTNQLQSALGVFAQFGDLNQSAKTRRIQKIDFAEIQNNRKLIGLKDIGDITDELLL